ncbi:hybrid sensor histidine kinase/response regulator [Leptospira sp. 96542]|nr:hybrid sensor histidine kinase/response regulator [Leptospira sp. 96542]
MMIEDPEFRELFQADSLEHIQNIETGLIELEKNPKDPDTLKTIFREAHSMKGAAGLLGLKDIEAITHILEDQLGKASKGQLEYNPANADRIYFALDNLRLLVEETVSGAKANIDLKKIIDVLNGTIPVNSPLAEEKPKDIIQKRKAEEKDVEKIDPINKDLIEISPKQSLPKEEGQKATKFKIDTMRVDPTKLDLLLGYSGELTVSKNRIQKRTEEISEILFSLEEQNKDWNDQKRIIVEAEKILKQFPGTSGLIESLKNLYSDQKKKRETLTQNLTNLKVKSIQDSAKLGLISTKLEEGIQNVRLLPLSSVFDIFPRTIRDISRELGKEVYLTLEGGHVTADKLIIEELKDPLMHLVRNSLDHGIESREDRISLGKQNPAKIRISGKMVNQTVLIEIEDDGAGLNPNTIKEKALQKGLYSKEELDSFSSEAIYEIIFHAGFSTKQEVSKLSGRGVGMDVVKTFVEKFKGNIEIQSNLGEGTKFIIRLPINFSTNHVLIIQSEGWKFGVPTEFIEQSVFLKKENIKLMEGKPVFVWQNQPVRLIAWKEMFPSPFPLTENFISKKSDSCMILQYNGERIAMVVDAILDKQEILLKPFNGIIKQIPMFAGTTILESGDICYMVQVSDVFSKLKGIQSSVYLFDDPNSKTSKKRILLTEDSLITRARLQSILEEGGYEVTTAVDGMDAFEKLQKTNFDLLMTDLEMPNKDGIELVTDVRKISRYQNFPILILTSLGSEEQIERGKLAGANAYLVKSKFDNSVLLKTVERLLV